MPLILWMVSLGLLLPSLVAADKTYNVTHVIRRAEEQYERVVASLALGKQYPIEGHMMGQWRFSPNYWTDGFFAGVLWQLYDHTKKDIWRQRAIQATDGLFEDQFITEHHDIGFMVMCSYGEGWRITQNATYKPIIINAANHLAMRYNEHVGMIRSWGRLNDRKHFLVIVDNMMNLPLLYTADRLKPNETLYHIATSHANRTLETHVRHDYSSFHVVDFDQTNGTIVRQYTAQGYSDQSCWARGQAWLINGYMQSYAFTKYEHHLKGAEHLASYFIAHLPEDGIPAWDFEVPHDAHHPYIPRDVSAGTVAAVGLFELYGVTHNKTYLDSAHKIVSSLSSDKYLISEHSNYTIPALLGNSTVAGPNADPNKSDLALIYADYYMLKALGYLSKYPIY